MKYKGLGPEFLRAIGVDCSGSMRTDTRERMVERHERIIEEMNRPKSKLEKTFELLVRLHQK